MLIYAIASSLWEPEDATKLPLRHLDTPERNVA
jgi:hypothetical protein